MPGFWPGMFPRGTRVLLVADPVECDFPPNERSTDIPERPAGREGPAQGADRRVVPPDRGLGGRLTPGLIAGSRCATDRHRGRTPTHHGVRAHPTITSAPCEHGSRTVHWIGVSSGPGARSPLVPADSRQAPDAAEPSTGGPRRTASSPVVPVSPTARRWGRGRPCRSRRRARHAALR